MKKNRVGKVNKGELFRLKESETAPVWVRGEFVREAGKYSCTKYDDTNHERLMKGSQAIYTGFTF